MSEETAVPEELQTSTPLLKSRLPYHLIETDDLLKQLVQDLTQTKDPIAIDAERASGFRYGQKAYLIQIGIKARAIYLIDPIAHFSEELWNEFIKATSTKPWIIHAASQDIPCLEELGIRPMEILDTELGSRILGLPRVSLGTITEHYLQLKLAKEHSAVDWSERPLREEWLEYAALDVDVLHELWEKVQEDLAGNHKLEIATEEFQYLIDQPAKPQKTERWRSMTGLHEIKDARSLTIAKSIWDAREELAVEKDIAPGRLIPDSAIVAAVKEMPKTKPELASLKTFSGRASRTFLDTWWAAFVEGNTTRQLVELRAKPTGIPNHRNWPIKFPEANARLVASRAAIAALSESMKIPPENILSPDTLRAICFEPPLDISRENVSSYLNQKNARPWQIEATAGLLIEALQAKTVETKEQTQGSAE